jgi:O-antigen/teichoic acid export membrane protein
MNNKHPSSLRTGRHMMIGTIIIFLAKTIILPTGFITAVFLARKLGPSSYGLFALVSRLVSWIEMTGASFFNHTTIKFVGEETNWRSIAVKVMHLYITMGLGIGLLLGLLSYPIALMFNEPIIADYLTLFAMEIPIHCLAAANLNILAGRGMFKEIAQITTVRLLARLILIILFVEMGLSVKGAIIGSIGASISGLVLSWYYARTPLFYKSEFSVRNFLNFATTLFMSRLSLKIFRLDLFILKAFGGTASQAGFYGAALNLSIPPKLVSSSLTPTLLSTLSHLISKKEIVKAKEIGLTAIRSVFWLIPFIGLAAGSANEIVCFIFGNDFLPASPIFILLLVAGLNLFMLSVINSILIALNKPKATLILTIPMIPLAIMGHLILTPKLGGIGASLVTALIACFGAISSLIVIYRIWNIYPPVQTVLRSIFCSLIVFVLANEWPVSGFMLILKLFVMTLAIPTIFWIIGEFSSSEKKLFYSITGKKIISK